MNHFANNIKYLRNRLGKTQPDLASDLGFKSRSQIANYETGTSKPSLDDFHKIVEYFKVSADDILNKDLSIETGENTIVAETSPEYGPKNSAYNDLLIKSYEIRIKSQEDMIAALKENIEMLSTTNESLMSMLKMNLEDKRAGLVEKQAIKKHR